MKKNHLATVAALAPLCAFAQSSVSLYGVLDEGLNYANNVKGDAVWEVASGYAQGSRWGMKGSEDLAGGLKAVFQLENGFDVSLGRGSARAVACSAARPL